MSTSHYNHTRRLLGAGEVDIANLKVLLTQGYTFDASETDTTNAVAAEVSGNGWSQGGEALANATVTTVNTADAMLDADNVSVSIEGGSLGPFDAYVLYDATNDNPLLHKSFSEITKDDGSTMLIEWASDGILRLQASA